MRYKDFEGPVEELVQLKLQEIEKAEQVKILHAVESGSRAWGFASPDSDYDVRFIYVREEEYYLRLEDTKDFIDWELDEVLDINGWDVRKALQLFHKSNASIFEWANSPIVYQTTEEWKKIYQVGKTYFSKKIGMYHYFGMAKHNYYQYLQQEYVNYKKYFYVLRPILACKWIDEKGCPPPVLFDELKESMLNREIRMVVDEILEEKKKRKESEAGVAVPKLNDYLLEQIQYYSQLIPTLNEERKSGWSELNQIFQSNLSIESRKDSFVK